MNNKIHEFFLNFLFLIAEKNELYYFVLKKLTNV